VNFTAAARPAGRARSSDTAAAVWPDRLQAPEMERRIKVASLRSYMRNLLDFAP
jgi:hypothetical protein